MPRKMKLVYKIADYIWHVMHMDVQGWKTGEKRVVPYICDQACKNQPYGHRKITDFSVFALS